MTENSDLFKIRDLSIDDGTVTPRATPVSNFIPDCDAEWSHKLKSILDSVDFLPPDKIYKSSDQVTLDRVIHHTDNLNHARRAALAHYSIRKEIMKLQPDTPYNFICTLVEQMTGKMLKNEKNDGLGFPTGISVNNCAAHYSCNLSTEHSENKNISPNDQKGNSSHSFGNKNIINSYNQKGNSSHSDTENNKGDNLKQPYIQNIRNLYNQANKSRYSTFFNEKGVNEIIKQSDVVKIDYGCHSNGFIIDSAFTLIYDDKFQNIADAAKEATYRGIKYMGVDCLVSEIGREISEVISSYELEVDGKTVPIQAVKNLNGHSIGPFVIHGGISIPNIYDPLNNQRIQSDTFYALETFATTGNGYVREGPNTTHFMIGSRNTIPSDPFNKKIWQLIKTNIDTLPFSQRFIKRLLRNDTSIVIETERNSSEQENEKDKKENAEPDTTKSNKQVKQKKQTNKNKKKKGKFIFTSHSELNKAIQTAVASLTALRILDPYPPLYDITGSIVAQFEHTLWIDEGGKEIVSRGEDY